MAGPRNEEARLLRRSKTAAGYCATCAVHDWLRNTYPVNIQLAESGPKILLVPGIRQMFADIMWQGNADIKSDEVNWNLLVENWELPWPHKMKPSPTNPCTQQEIDEIATGKRKAFGNWPPPPDPLPGVDTITSFKQLNQLEPGLGDDLRKTFGKALDRPGTAGETEADPPGDEGSDDDNPPDDEPPIKQRDLF